MDKEKIKKIEYRGDGMILGVPTRDMDIEEWEQLPNELKQAALKTGLYKIVTISEAKNAQ